MVASVRDLMTKDVKTLRIGDTLDLAEDVMQLERIRHLPVVDGGGKLVGLITHRDLLRAWVSHGLPWKEDRKQLATEVPVEMLMRTEIRTVSPATPAKDAAELLETNKYGCLPVVEDGGRLVGIVTEADFVHFAAEYFRSEKA